MKKKILVVGSGFSGAVIARELASVGLENLLIEKNNHVAENYLNKRKNNS